MRTLQRFRLPFIFNAVLALIAAAPDRGTSSLVGSVAFLGSSLARAREPNLYGYEPPRRIAPATIRTAVVYLEDSTGRLDHSHRLPPKVIDQRNEAFDPKVLAVEVGTRVNFPNSDSIYHNVFSLSKPKRFDLGRYPKGESRSVVFDRTGVVRVFCEIHSHMSAFVIVLPHAYFDTTDEDGAYRIDGIPPGRYRVVVWSDPFESVTREVELGPDEEKQVDFTLIGR